MSKCLIDFNDAVIWQNKVWFFSNDFNGLYSIDLSNQEIEFRGQVPFEPQSEQHLYSSLVIWENKIYLIPSIARRMAVYDMVTGNFEPLDLLDVNKHQLFYGNCLYGNNLFLFHFYDKTILKINLKSKEITVLDEWVDKISPYLFKNSGANFTYFRKQLVCRKGKIYIPFCYANAVLEIDCENLQSDIHIIGTAEQGYSGICEDGEDLWMAPKQRNGAVVRWNPKTGHKDIFQCKDDSSSLAYIGIAKEHGQIFLYSAVELPQFPHNSSFEIKPDRYRFVSVSDQYVLALDIDKNALIIYDKATDEERESIISIEYENTPLFQAFKERVVMESRTQSLPRLFDAIDLEEEYPKVSKATIGESIYRVISSYEEEKNECN